MDFKVRIADANKAFFTLTRLWQVKGKHLKIKTKLEMYRTYITPILTYNLAASANTRADLDLINAAHRKHLRYILRIFYPQIISNEKLYKISNTEPIMYYIFESRLKMLGHVLRQGIFNQNIPAFQFMRQYFLISACHKREKGRRPTTIHSEIEKHLNKHEIPFHTIEDLYLVAGMAKNRPIWRQLCENIMTAIRKDEEAADHKRNINRNRKRKKDAGIITIPPKRRAILIIRPRRFTMDATIAEETQLPRIEIIYRTVGEQTDEEQAQTNTEEDTNMEID